MAWRSGERAARISELLHAPQRERFSRGRQEGRAQHEWRKTQPYDFSQRVPQFGTAPGFGADYVQTKSHQVPVQGKPNPAAPKITKKRRNSSFVPLKKNYGKPYQAGARRRKSYRPTDQKPLGGHGGSAMSRWDGKVRNKKKATRGVYASKTGRKKGKRTWADIHEEELKNFPYDFSN